MGPHDYGRRHGMTQPERSEIRQTLALSPGAHATTREREAALMAELPGWDVWATAPLERHCLLWHARPSGARSAVINDAPSPWSLAEAVHAYQADLPGRIADAEASMRLCPDTGYGADQRAVLRALVTALERLQALEALITRTEADAER